MFIFLLEKGPLFYVEYSSAWAPTFLHSHILCLSTKLSWMSFRTVAVDFLIYCHYVCCLSVAWGCWVIACCLEGLCTICLISAQLQLINIELFAYVCTFHIQVLVIYWFYQLSSLSMVMFFTLKHFHLIQFSMFPLVFCLISKSRPTLCYPMDCGPPDSSADGISQARIL